MRYWYIRSKILGGQYISSKLLDYQSQLRQFLIEHANPETRPSAKTSRRHCRAWEDRTSYDMHCCNASKFCFKYLQPRLITSSKHLGTFDSFSSLSPHYILLVHTTIDYKWRFFVKTQWATFNILIEWLTHYHLNNRVYKNFNSTKKL